MNFKKIVSKVNLHAGLQGSVSSVEATDYQEYLAEAVRSAWVDLQNEREDWKFMWETDTFSTSAGINEYSNASIMTAAGNTWGVAKWKLDAFYKDSDKMTEVEWEFYRDNEDGLKEADSKSFVIKEFRDAGIIILGSEAIHSIQTEYYRTPQELLSNTDIPLLPEEFHYILVWKALEDVAAYLGNSAIYERHSWKYDTLINKLMKSQVPAKKMKRKPFYRKRLYQH